MRKLQKVMLGIFCAGVFLTGLGTGLSFYEASCFTYGGEKVIGPLEMNTETYECSFEPREDEKFLIFNGYYYNRGQERVITPDPNVPEKTVRFEVTYNEKAARPFLYCDDGMVRLEYDYLSDDFKAFMDCKDQILQELKEKKISSYRTETIKDIKISVNPDTMDMVTMVR